MKISIRPIGANFVGEVSGLDCKQKLPPEVVSSIEENMDRFGVLVFPAQQLSDYEQLAFTLHFGQIEKKGRGSGRGQIHFRTLEQTRTLAKGIGDFSNVDDSGIPLKLDTRAHQFK